MNLGFDITKILHDGFNSASANNRPQADQLLHTPTSPLPVHDQHRSFVRVPCRTEPLCKLLSPSILGVRHLQGGKVTKRLENFHKIGDELENEIY
jgi:hypothetical protein